MVPVKPQDLRRISRAKPAVFAVAKYGPKASFAGRPPRGSEQPGEAGSAQRLV